MSKQHTTQRELFESGPRWVEDDARHGTIAGTQVRDVSERPRPSDSGEKSREPAASSTVGQASSGMGCTTRRGLLTVRGW